MSQLFGFVIVTMHTFSASIAVCRKYVRRVVDNTLQVAYSWHLMLRFKYAEQ